MVGTALAKVNKTSSKRKNFFTVKSPFLEMHAVIMCFRNRGRVGVCSSVPISETGTKDDFIERS
jgi:hypothetical protein